MRDFGSKYSKSRLTKDCDNEPATKKKINRQQNNNDIVNLAVDKIILRENKKLSAGDETHGNIYSEIDENGLYTFDNMSLDEKKENMERHKRAFERELKNTYDIEIQNGMNFIHRNKVNKVAEFNLLHDILNPSKHTKHLNIHYSPILHGCMNTRKGREYFKRFQILLDSGCSSTIVMGRLIIKLLL